MKQRLITASLIPLLWLAFLGCGDDNPNGPSPTTYGSIYVESIPAGANIYLDGSNTSQLTPATLTDIETGNHTVKLTLADYEDWTRSVYVEEDVTDTVTVTLYQFALNIYWPIAGFERLDSAWVPKDSLIQLKARDQNGNSVSNVTWHSSDPTIASINSNGTITGLKDWFDNDNSQPEATVWATKNELTSNEMIVQTVINLTGEWERESDGLVCDVTMRCHQWAIHWAAGPFQPIGALQIFGDSLYWKDPYGSDSWASGHILEDRMRVEYTGYSGYGEADYAYIKNSD